MLRPVLARSALLVVCTWALAGCGGGPTPDEQIRETLARFQRATAAHDYGALCDRILAPQLIETVKRIGLPCELALQKGFEGVRDPQLSVGAITVEGERASAQVRSSAAGQAPSEDTVDLVKVGDGWRIASLGAQAP
jgi:hypothetical protein